MPQRLCGTFVKLLYSDYLPIAKLVQPNWQNKWFNDITTIILVGRDC